jgi:Tfp pilus assembly protein PilF
LSLLRGKKVVMKVLKRIDIAVLMVFLFLVGPCFGQNDAEQIWIKGVEYAAQGNFNEAKEKFEKVLKVDPSYESA